MKRPTIRFAATLVLAAALGVPPAAVGDAAHGEATRAFQFNDVPFSNGVTGTIRAVVRISEDGGSRSDARYYGPDGEYLGAYAESDGFASHHEVLVWRWALQHFADRG